MAPAQERIYPLPLSKQIEGHDSTDLRENAKAQAEGRWSWFADAERIDKIRATDLGTLGYLPWELRQEILMVLVARPPTDKLKSHLGDCVHKYWSAFAGWTLRPLGFALWRCECTCRLLAAHHATRVTSRFDNLEQFGQCGRLEFRPYFSACEPRFDYHGFYNFDFLTGPEDDVVKTFSDREIIDFRPEEPWPRKPFLRYGSAGDATIGNLRQASRNLREEFDGSFFATHNCFLASPGALELFCTSPMVRHAQCQGRISIMIPILSISEQDEASEKARMEHWYTALESLPSDLKSLAIYLRYRKKTASGWDKHFQRLDRILHKARRYAPNAKITIGLTYVHKTEEDRLRDPGTSEDTMIRGIRKLLQDQS